MLYATLTCTHFTPTAGAGRSALLLSGGLSFGLYHFGVVKALFERGCLPRVISGASIGALVAALLGINTDQELVRGIQHRRSIASRFPAAPFHLNPSS